MSQRQLDSMILDMIFIYEHRYGDNVVIIPSSRPWAAQSSKRRKCAEKRRSRPCMAGSVNVPGPNRVVVGLVAQL